MRQPLVLSLEDRRKLTGRPAAPRERPSSKHAAGTSPNARAASLPNQSSKRALLRCPQTRVKEDLDDGSEISEAPSQTSF